MHLQADVHSLRRALHVGHETILVGGHVVTTLCINKMNQDRTGEPYLETIINLCGAPHR